MASYKRAGTSLYDLVDRFFNDGFSISTPLKNIIIDVQEFDDRYVVEADVPGVDKKDINVTFNNDYLKISLEASDEIDDKASSKTTKQQEEQPEEQMEQEPKRKAGGTDSSADEVEFTGEQTTSEDSADENSEKNEKTKSEKTSTNSADNTEDSGDHYIHRERMYAMVSRVVYLKGATSKGIKGELKDGVLTLTVPKREDAMNQNQTIEID